MYNYLNSQPFSNSSVISSLGADVKIKSGLIFYLEFSSPFCDGDCSFSLYTKLSTNISPLK